jgi:hypothetical protein
MFRTHNTLPDVVVVLLTVTVLLELLVFPDASYALAIYVCDPLLSLVVLSLTL